MSIKIEVATGYDRPCYIEVPIFTITTDENGNEYDNKLPLISQFTAKTIAAVMRELRVLDREEPLLAPAKRPRDHVDEELRRPKRVRVLSPAREGQAQGEKATVAVTLRNSDHERRFNLRQTWKLKRALKTFAEEAGLVLEKQRLHWVGMGCIVDPSGTPESLQLQDGDQFDVLTDMRQ